MRVQVKQVSKSYLGKRGEDHGALENVSLEIGSGEMLTLVGPSGAGKTSLLKIIAGLDEPNLGHVLLGGEQVLSIPPAERDIFFLFQDALLYPGLSVSGNLALPLRRRRLSKLEIAESIRSIATVFQVSECLKSMPECLSNGERQRVALARAILSEPKLLLLDEPLTGLESELRYRLKREIVGLRERKGTTIVSVTHDPFEAFTLGDRVAVMQGGQLQQVDIPELVYRYPANKFVAGFIGNPPMNFVSGTVVLGPEGLIFRSQRSSGATVGLDLEMPENLCHLAGRELVAGIRPEDIGLAVDDVKTRPSYESVVERVERFEDATLITLTCFELFLVARVRGQGYDHGMGSVKITIESSKVIWFDAVSQDRIS